MPEVCNGIDDDCNGLVDDGLTSQTCFADTDHDGAGDPHNRMVTCAACPAGFLTTGTDCDDMDPSAHPGQMGWFTTPRAGIGGFDYDCDGLDTVEVFPPCQLVGARCTAAGVWTVVPGCGMPGTRTSCTELISPLHICVAGPAGPAMPIPCH
jgi:hypothetical protein